MAAAVLPSLLPTPPQSKMVPVLPTPCLIILPLRSSFAALLQPKPKPGRSDAGGSWNAHKKPSTTSPQTERVDGVSNLPGRASACERWDSNKKQGARSTSSSSECGNRDGSESPSHASSSSERVGSRKWSPPSRESSDERWDLHKKKKSPSMRDDGIDDDGRSGCSAESKTSEQEIDEEETFLEATKTPAFAGPSYFVSPEPSMLPIPSFLMAH